MYTYSNLYAMQKSTKNFLLAPQKALSKHPSQILTSFYWLYNDSLEKAATFLFYSFKFIFIRAKITGRHRHSQARHQAIE